MVNHRKILMETHHQSLCKTEIMDNNPPKGDNPVNENYSEGGATATVQNVKINTSKDKSHQSILDVLIKMTHLVKKYRH